MKEENKHGWFEFKWRADNIAAIVTLLGIAFAFHGKFVHYEDVQINQGLMIIAAQERMKEDENQMKLMQETQDRTSQALTKLATIVDERSRKEP